MPVIAQPEGVAMGVSAGGLTVVGEFGGQAFIWDPAHHMRYLREVLVTEFGLGAALEGWQLRDACSISADGRTIVGEARSPTSSRSYVVTLSYPCFPNCDASTSTPALNATDFQCFLTRFAASDPYANCDLSTTPPVLNANDFMCFVNAFAAGCL